MRILIALTALVSLAHAHGDTKPAAEAKPAAADANPITSTMTHSFDRIKKFLLASAEMVAPADYAFKPTPEVRSFGEIIGHVADANYHICSTAKKESSPAKGSVERTAKTKADFIKGLQAALAYCDGVYASTTDASLTEPREIFGMKMNKFGVLNLNLQHDNEHYGMLVTYLRMKKLVPPSSAEK